MHFYLSITLIHINNFNLTYNIICIYIYFSLIMAQAASNSIDVDLFQQITAQDSEIQSTAKPASSPSSAFVRKCLHPPSAIPNFEGMPTNDARTQVTVEWRGIDLLNPPATLIGGVVSPVGFFDEYALLIPNGGRVKYLGFVSSRHRRLGSRSFQCRHH